MENQHYQHYDAQRRMSENRDIRRSRDNEYDHDANRNSLRRDHHRQQGSWSQSGYDPLEEEYDNRRTRVRFVPDHDDNRGTTGQYREEDLPPYYRQQQYQEENPGWQNSRNRYLQSSRERNQGRLETWQDGTQYSGYPDYEGRNYNDPRYSETHRQVSSDRHPDDRGAWQRTRDEVASWFGDDDAERRRDADRTYDRFDRENHPRSNRGKGPRGYVRSQERIHEDVCDRLMLDDRLDASDIEVKVEEQEVILTGNVTSKQAKRRAEDVAESIPGVRNVQNRLKIVAPDVGTTETMNTIIRNTGTMPDRERTDRV